MLPFTSHQDPGDETDFQLELLPAERECRCGAKQASECEYVNLWSWEERPTGKQPRTCLRRVDPTTAPFPPGF